ncbi:MAG: hypothetical protein ACON4U_15005 [Myxococcota bacterium]
MFVFSLLLTFSCEEPMPIGEVPQIPVPDPTPSATDAMQNRSPSVSNGDGPSEGAPPATTEAVDVPRNELGCGPTRFWAGSTQDTDTVTLSGTIDFNSEQNGSYLIDVVSNEAQKAVFGFECTKPGEFSIDVPSDLEAVWLFAFIDTDGNGPSENDPQGRTEYFEIGTDNVSGLSVPIRIGATVKEAFELKPPGQSSGAGTTQAPIDPNITEPPPEGVPNPSEGGNEIADQPLDVPQDNPPVGALPADNPNVDPQSGDANDAQE